MRIFKEINLGKLPIAAIAVAMWPDQVKMTATGKLHRKLSGEISWSDKELLKLSEILSKESEELKNKSEHLLRNITELINEDNTEIIAA